MAGPHVFEDGRLGLWIVDVGRGLSRLAAIRAQMPYVTDLFLHGSQGTPAAKAAVLRAGFVGCHAYWPVDGLTAHEYALRCFADIARWQPGAGDLNIELATDAALEPFMRQVAGELRAGRPNYRLRLNVAWRKGGFLPIDLLAGDANLYSCVQNYVGAGMEPTSAADALESQLDAGVPLAKAAVCFGAAGAVGGATGSARVVTLPHGEGWTPSRGVVFQDDLAADAGLLA